MKLKYLVRCYAALTAALSGGTNGEKPTVFGADELLTAVIYMILRGNPSQLISNLRYVQRFSDGRLLNGPSAYMLTMLDSAVAYIETLDADALRTNAAPAQQPVGGASDTPAAPPAAPLLSPSQPDHGADALLDAQPDEDLTHAAQGAAALFDAALALSPPPGSPRASDGDASSGPSAEAVAAATAAVSAAIASLAAPATTSNAVVSTTTIGIAQPALTGAGVNTGRMQRFLAMHDADELTLADVRDLFADYKQLAALLIDRLQPPPLPPRPRLSDA